MGSILKNRLEDEQEETSSSSDYYDQDESSYSSRMQNLYEEKKKRREDESYLKGFEYEDGESQKEEPEEEDIRITEEDVREMEKLNTFESEEDSEAAKKKAKRKLVTGYVILSAICAYLVLLIYGVFVTNFSYGSSGQIKPDTLSVKELQERNEYDELLAFYLQARSVYEEVLVLDWKMQQEKTDMIALGSEYQAELDRIDKAVNQLEGSSISKKYKVVANLIDSFLATHLTSYCNYMAIALSTNDQEAANQALAARETASSIFEKTTENMYANGKDIKGVDLQQFIDWTPSNYIQKEVLGIDPSADTTGAEDGQ